MRQIANNIGTGHYSKVLVGKTGNVIERPVNKLCPVEFANEFQSKPTDDGIVKPRPRRNAAVLADIKVNLRNDTLSFYVVMLHLIFICWLPALFTGGVLNLF